ncbi:YbfB/YjiJ family MFS transporter [Micromonospora sp. NPDC049301]|uniref:YbfB/YjiJ family MFS transporter n=1 Tax=Micromonospora sp. NPDC049301 TaxID=3155723 RepID=UPI003412CB8C
MTLETRAAASAPWWQSMGLALGTASALGLGRFAYGLFVPAMSQDLDWTMSRAGALTAANGAGYLLGAVISPAVIRGAGLTATFRAGMVLTALALAATGLDLLAWGRAAAGLGGALTFISGAALATQLANRAATLTPVSVYFAGAGGGIAVTGASVPLLLHLHPERWAVGWWALAGAAALASAASWRAAAISNATGPTAAVSGRHLWRQWRIASAYLLFGAGYIGYLTFLSAYLAGRHASLAMVCVTWVLVGASAMVAPVLWSRPIVTWGGNRPLCVMLLGVAAAAALARGRRQRPGRRRPPCCSAWRS